VSVEANAAAATTVLRVPLAMDVESWNRAAQEQQAAALNLQRTLSENLQAGRPVLRPVPTNNQSYGESEIIELDSEPTPRKRRWSTGPNPFSW
jgi:hypothetical protein